MSAMGVRSPSTLPTHVFEHSPTLIVAMGRGKCTRLETANHARAAESTVAL